jgi:hypothetical protein
MANIHSFGRVLWLDVLPKRMMMSVPKGNFRAETSGLGLITPIS